MAGEMGNLKWAIQVWLETAERRQLRREGADLQPVAADGPEIPRMAYLLERRGARPASDALVRWVLFGGAMVLGLLAAVHDTAAGSTHGAMQAVSALAALSSALLSVMVMGMLGYWELVCWQVRRRSAGYGGDAGNPALD